MNRSQGPQIFSSVRKQSPYPPIDSISSSVEQEVLKIEPAKGKNYKPLVALNIDIGEEQPVKIFIYDFTDPWKRAYEFLKAYDLPEEMHEEIAMLISNAKEAKEKELRIHRLAHEKPTNLPAMGGLRLPKANSKQRGASYDLKQSNSTKLHFDTEESVTNNARRVLIHEFEQQSQIANPQKPLMERNRSTDHFLLVNKPAFTSMEASPWKEMQTAPKSNLAQELFNKDLFQPSLDKSKETQNEKSTVMDSTAILSSQSERDKSKTIVPSPFQSGLAEIGDFDSTHTNQRNSSQSQNVSDVRWSSAQPTVSSDVNNTLQYNGFSDPASDAKVKELFTRLDYDSLAVVRSFDVYLSNLTSETKNLLHSILSVYDRPNGFKTFTYEQFRAALLNSTNFSMLSLEKATN